jgi:hypothetical protein
MIGTVQEPLSWDESDDSRNEKSKVVGYIMPRKNPGYRDQLRNQLSRMWPG